MRTQGVVLVKGALVLGAMEERGGGAWLQLQDIQAWREKLSRAITFTFPNLKFSLSVTLRILSVLEGSHDPKILAMLD